MTQKEKIKLICDEFVVGLRQILDDVLHGVYIYGAAAFPDTIPTHDIDFHVILNRSLTGPEKARLESFHGDLGKKYPPLGEELDGYYILLEDAQRRESPRSELWANAIDESWALHCAHIHAGRCIVLNGPDPQTIYPVLTWTYQQQALLHELDYVREHLTQYPDYCILNLSRLIYSFQTQDVVLSKADGAQWALENLPTQWHHCIELACQSYRGESNPKNREVMKKDVLAFYEFAELIVKKSQVKITS